MTTPNQPAPAGAYVIDTGGGETQFGQGMTETGAASLMTGGFTSINLGDPLGAIESVASLFIKTLSQIPLEVLQLFEGLIPDALEGAFSTVAGAIDAIFNHIQSLGPLLASAFKGFLEVSFNVLQSAFGQIMDIVQGLIVTPINGAVAGFKDWFVGLMGGTIPDLGTAVSGAVSAAEGAVADLADLIHGLLTAPGSFLGNIPQTLVDGLDGVVDGLSDGINDAVGFIRDIIDAIVRGIRGIPFVGGSIANAIDNLTGAVSHNQANQQNAVITVATSGGYRNPAWVCSRPLADVSYAECLNSAAGSFGATDSTTNIGVQAHTHPISNTKVFSSPAFQGISDTQSRGVIITASSEVVYDTVGLVLQLPGAHGTVQLVVDVFRKNPAGNWAQVSSAGDVASLVASGITGGSGQSYVEAPISPPIIAQAQEDFLVLVRRPHAGGGSTSVGASMMGLQQLTISPRVRGVFLAFDLGVVSSIPAATVTAGLTGILPWAMLASVNTAQADQSHSDDFNRVALGPLWFPVSTTGTIGITSSQAAYKGGTNGDQLGLYIKSVAGDQMQVEANLYNRVTTPRLGIMSCCNRELTEGVYLGVNAGTANLYTGAWNSLTQQKSVTVTTGDAKWGLYNDPSTSTFYIMRDDTDIDTWVDTGGVVTLDADHRFGGIRISRASSVNAGTLDNFTLRDFAR